MSSTPTAHVESVDFVMLYIVGISVVLLLGITATMIYFGYTSFREIRDIPANAFKVKVEAMMWKFTFKYENGKQTDTLYVPINTPVHLEMTSMDVNHAFFIPAFRIKEDVIHNKVNNLYFKPEKLGKYDVACAEYCGLKHSMMYTAVKVLPKQEFDNWYAVKTNAVPNVSEVK